MNGWLKETISLLPQLLGQCFCFGAAFVALMYLFHRKMSFFRGWLFRIGGFVAVMVLGILFYATHPVVGDDGRCLAPVNRALSSFFRSQGGFETLEASEVSDRKAGKRDEDGAAEEKPSNEKKAPGMDLYYVYHLLVAFYLAGLTFSFYGREFWNAGFRWWYRKNVAVIWGWSKRGELLARDLIEKHHMRVLFILDRATLFDDAKRGDLLDRFGKMNRGDGSAGISSHDCIFWDFEDFENPSVTAAKGKIHCFLSDSGRANIALTNRVWELNPAGRPEFFVRVESSSDERFFVKWVEKMRQRVELRIVKESAAIASNLIEAYPIPLQLAGGEKLQYRVLIVGFGVNGQAVLNKILETSQSLGQDVYIDIVDERERSWEKYQARCPDIVENAKKYHVRFVGEYSVGTVKFDAWLRSCLESQVYDRIVSCLGAEKTTEDFCMLIDRLYKSAVLSPLPAGFVFVQIDEELFPGNIGEITRFGKLEDIYKKDTLYPEDDVRLGMEVNRWYTSRFDGKNDKFSEEANKKGRAVALKEEWNGRPYFKQQSSVASAQGMRQILRMLGYACKPFDCTGCNFPACDPAKCGKINGELLEELKGKVDQHARELAEDEHERWMAFHFVRGIRSFDVKRIPWVALQIGANQIEDLNAHAALVQFDEIPKVDRDLDIAGGNDEALVSCRFEEGRYGGKFGTRLPRTEKEKKLAPDAKELGALQAFDYMFGDLILDRELLCRLRWDVVPCKDEHRLDDVKKEKT